MKSNSDWLPIFCLLTAMVLWGSSFIALKISFVHYDPMVVIFGRMLVASICFLFFLGRFGKIRYRRGDWRYITLMAVSEPCLYFIFEARAMLYTSASQAGMITAMLPLMVAVGAHFFLKEKVSARTFGGFAVAVAGACLLSLGAAATEGAPNPALGNLYELMAMVCAAFYTLSLKHLSARYSPLLLTAIQAFVGTVFFFPFLLLPATTLPQQYVPEAAFAIIYLGAFVTLGAYGLYNFGVSRIPASQASAYVNLIPIFSVIMGRIFLKETFTPIQYLASAMVFAGVYISHEKRRRTESAGQAA